MSTKKTKTQKPVKVPSKKAELTEEKIENYSNALQATLKEEPPEEQIRILKLLLKDAQTRIKIDTENPEDEDELVADWQTAEFPYKRRMSNKRYEKEKLPLQVELLKLQKWVKETGRKIIIIFEGRDAAGKGGTIRTFMEHLNPRGARVVALPKPTEAEKGQWYFQRYVAHLPSPGEIVLFDRSWYNRAVVEPVMGFCTPEQTQQFLAKEEELLEMLLPQYVAEGKSQLVISVGCTGGQHRSVYIANKLAAFLRRQGYKVLLSHRDLRLKNR